eukprot:TRINITY_DN5585_c0_g1_i3.p1 TRINITY_DN5585_c0_g1~~TRINITY_DN5585_c0_g1_i3.p1  ORF type:complete len:633 (+),score=263.40 TRINITY_DN5585_c0_g1_i3:130-2028(+)
MVWEHATLDAIRGDLSKVAEENNWERYHTPRNLLLALQKEVGDLAEVFKWEDPHSRGWHKEDFRLVEEELGDIMAYTIRLADKCGVDLASVMNHKLNKTIVIQANGPQSHSPPTHQHTQQHTQQHVPTHSPVPQQYSQVHHTAPPPAPAPQRHASPGKSSPEPARAMQHKSPQSTLSTQSGNPRQSPTHKRPQPLDSDSLRKHDIASKRPAFKRTLSVVCNNGGPPPEELYSPTHFQHDLFSPVCNKRDFEVDTKKPVLPQSVSKTELEKLQLQKQSAKRPPREPASPLSPKSLGNFFNILDELQKSDFNDEDLQDMNLTFCGVAFNGKIVPLVEGGIEMEVTKELLPEYIRLAMEMKEKGSDFVPKPPTWVKPAEGGPFAAASAAASATRPNTQSPSKAQSSKDRKKTLRRTLSVQLPSQMRWEDEGKPRECFSPTHFDKDLFSPTTNKTDFEVEYTLEGGRKTLPADLKPKEDTNGKQHLTTNADVSPKSPGKKLTPVNSAVRRHSVASFCSDEDEEYRGLDLLLEVAEEDQEKLCKLKQHLRAATMSPRTRELDRDFLPMISDIEMMLADQEITDSDLQEMELMFCIPSGGKVYSLIHDGETTRVTLDRLPEFLALAKDKKRELDALEG